jgi:hypothetical protein
MEGLLLRGHVRVRHLNREALNLNNYLAKRGGTSQTRHTNAHYVPLLFLAPHITGDKVLHVGGVCD